MRAAATLNPEWTAPSWLGPDHPGQTDQVAKVCMLHLPPKVRGYINSYAMKDFVFFTAVFKNGHEVTFRSDWREFVAECILVHDLPPTER